MFNSRHPMSAGSDVGFIDFHGIVQRLEASSSSTVSEILAKDLHDVGPNSNLPIPEQINRWYDFMAVGGISTITSLLIDPVRDNYC